MVNSLPERSWKILFAGSPDYAVPSLAALLRLPNVEVVGVLTQKPKPRGRGHLLQPSSVAAYAASKDLLVLTPDTLRNPDTQALITALHADAGVVVAYGKIIPQFLLEALPHGWVNAHASLLPRWRGASPIQQALLAGDSETGVTLMRLEPGMDTGPTFAVEKVSIGPADTSETLAKKLSECSAQLLTNQLPAYLAGKCVLTAQPTVGVTSAPLLQKADSLLSPHETAQTLERKVRAFQPWPGVRLTVRGRTFKILKAATAPGRVPVGQVVPHATGFAIGTAAELFVPLQIQLPGKKPVSAQTFVTSHPDFLTDAATG